MSNVLPHLLLIPLRICPVAPPGVQKYTDNLIGMVLFFVITIFIPAMLVSIGAIVAGKMMHQQHVMKAGIGGVVVVLLAAVGLVTFPDLPMQIIGNGCIG